VSGERQEDRGIHHRHHHQQALGKSSLKPEDCIADYSELTEKELEVLDQWHAFFSKRYNIIGKVVPDN